MRSPTPAGPAGLSEGCGKLAGRQWLEESPWPSGFQLVIDCANPDRLARFWAAALGYEFPPPPDGFASWDDYWRDVGVPEDELGIGEDRIANPDGRGPRIWFQSRK